MTIDLSAQWRSGLADVRYTSTPKRLRATLDGEPALDTTDALLVWEPRRVVPHYAVPAQDLRVELDELASAPPPPDLPPVMGPHHFSLHTCAGTALAPTSGASAGVEVGFRPDDPALGGRIILDFARFEWTEEDEPVMGHAHDPFKRIDVLRSDRHVVVRLGDTVLADSRRAHALYETSLPVRWYLPTEDVRMDLLTLSQHRTVCAYKGRASYLSADLEGGTDIGWFYSDPLHDALQVRDLVAFWSERTDLTVDGVRVAGRMPDAAPDGPPDRATGGPS